MLSRRRVARITVSSVSPVRYSSVYSQRGGVGSDAGPLQSGSFCRLGLTESDDDAPQEGLHASGVILDLSYPHGESVNSGVPPGWLYGAEFKMRLPNP